MVKLIYVITRKEGLSVAEFQAHWRETHAPIAAAIPGIRRYVQCHTLPELYDAERAPSYDGVAELWFDDLAAMRKAFGTEETATAREDELKFIDHSKSFMIVTEEKPIIE